MKRSSEKSFGILFFVVFAIIGLWPLLNGNPIRIWSLSIAAAILAIAIFKPNILTPFNNTWIKLGEKIGHIIAPIIMFLIFIFVVTPTGLILKLFRKDILNLKFSKNSNSYWIKRNKNVGSMKRQF